MTKYLPMATKEIVEEISQDLHLILSLQPKKQALTMFIIIELC